MKTAKKQNMGFSLMELMVTVAILGIIAGIAVPNYFQYVENTRLTQVRTVMAQIQQEVQTLFPSISVRSLRTLISDSKLLAAFTKSLILLVLFRLIFTVVMLISSNHF